MRVLFAVSNDNIATSIVNKYQQKYKEIITNKNVYYFNAIINELQKNKSYDAIVIGEDLEPISNNNYDEIDRFLFEKLDGISDEASKPTGEDIPIILICSDRRTKSDQLLIKLFGIGIYNAIIGNDRSIDTVCNLIYKPRNKKEAKLYYKVDAENVGRYERGDDQDVSEVEIQNILAHYRKIGLNEKKCVESFEKIAEQYNDTQLRLIINFLPKEVKDILEVNSVRYKKLVSNGTVLSNGKYTQYNKQNPRKPGKLDILTKDLKKTNLSKPIVIPSTINVNKDVKTNNNIQNSPAIVNQNAIQAKPMQQMQNIEQTRQMQSINQMQNFSQARQIQNQPSYVKENQINQQPSIQPNTQSNIQPSIQSNAQPSIKQNTLSNTQQNNNKTQGVDKGMQTLINSNDNNDINQNLENVAPNAEAKRGRGRPRKVQVAPTVTNTDNNLSAESLNSNVSVEPVIKRKRGRPPKKLDTQVQGDSINNTMQQLPIQSTSAAMQNTVANSNQTQNYDDILPGLEETKEEPVDLFGMSPIDETTINTANSNNNDNNYYNNTLPGLEENIESINMNNDNLNSDNNLFDLDLEESNTSKDQINNTTNNDLYNMSNTETNNTSDLYNMSNTETNNTSDLYNMSNTETNNTSDLYSMTNTETNNTPDLYSMSNMETNNNPNLYSTSNTEMNNNADLYNMSNTTQNTFVSPYNNNFNNNSYQNIYEMDNMYGNNQVQYNPMQNNQSQNNQPQNINQNPYNQNNFVNNTNDLMNMQNQNPVNNNVIAGNGKIAIFVGTTKNGTSFIVNNLAQLLSQNGVKTAILDLTRNKNSYYMFTDNDANLMKKATDSIKNLSNGIVEGLDVNKNLTVFTSLPDGIEETNKDTIIQTLSNNFEITLLDCDFNTNIEYFIKANEIYLIQTMDTFTIQPLTQFLSDLKLKNVLDESKLRVIINKYVRLRKLDEKMIIGGMSKYNEPSMTLQRDLFNAQTIKSVTIPFEIETYAKYLESIAMCNLNLNGYSQNFLNSLETLKNMVYPLISGGNYNNNSQIKTEEKRGLFGNKKNKNTTVQGAQFSNNVNDTLNKMRTNNF